MSSVAALCIAVHLNAQIPLEKGRSGNADADWAELASLAASSGKPGSHVTKPGDEHPVDHSGRVMQARRVANAAREFSLDHPSDARVREARKIEAISGLRGMTRDDAAQESEALTIARAYRDDPAMGTRDRFDIAVAMDTHDMGRKLKAGAAKSRAAEQKKLVESWRLEFGDMPELQAYAIAAARRGDPKTATEIASDVMRSTSATAPHKREAKAIIDRAMLLGKPVNLSVPLVDGGEIDLTQQQGHVTIVVVWSPLKPGSLDPLGVFKRRLPRSVQLVCLALGGTTDDVMRVRPALPAVTHFGHAPIGPMANRTAVALKLQLAPYIYVLNTSGVLSDFGPLSEVRAVLTRAGVTATKTS